MAHLFQLQKKVGEDYVQVTFIESDPYTVQIIYSNDPSLTVVVTKEEAFDHVLKLSKENGTFLEFLGSHNL